MIVVILSSIVHPEQHSSVIVPDGWLDCMVENESSTDEVEQSAACLAVAKGKAKQTARQKIHPRIVVTLSNVVL